MAPFIVAYLLFGAWSQASWAQSPADLTPYAGARDYGTIIRLSKWTSSVINVCWENPNSDNSEARDTVRRAVEQTWGAYSGLVFQGWSACLQDTQGIRILLSDEHSRVLAIGRFLDGRPGGMILNVSFRRWNPTCRLRLQFCIHAIAVHEFGHAIGLTHEQNRPDAPEQCKADTQGSVGDLLVTEYDPDSIMNYCNPNWNGNGLLSKLDIVTVRRIYYEKTLAPVSAGATAVDLARTPAVN